jgi:hypothetical protein
MLFFFSAGGCIKYPTYDNNPKFLLTPTSPPSGKKTKRNKQTKAKQKKK